MLLGTRHVPQHRLDGRPLDAVEYSGLNWPPQPDGMASLLAICKIMQMHYITGMGQLSKLG